jgi:hypothetical protein
VDVEVPTGRHITKTAKAAKLGNVQGNFAIFAASGLRDDAVFRE